MILEWSSPLINMKNWNGWPLCSFSIYPFYVFFFFYNKNEFFLTISVPSGNQISVFLALVAIAWHIRCIWHKSTVRNRQPLFEKGFHGVNLFLRRFAAVSPFCFGYPAQPDIASWRIRIIMISIDRRFSSPLESRRQGRYPRSLEAVADPEGGQRGHAPPPLPGEPQFFFRCWAVRSHVRACKMSDRACHMHARRLLVGLRDLGYLLHVSGSAEAARALPSAWQTVETLKMRKKAYFDSWIFKIFRGSMPRTPLGSSGFARGQPRCGCIHIHFYNLPLQPLLGPPPPVSKSWIRPCEAFFFTPVDFLSVSRHDARAPLEREKKDVDFRRVQLLTEWCLKARNGSGGNVDDVDRSTSRRVGAWSIFWTSHELFSAVVSVVFPFLCWWTWGINSRSFTAEEVDSSPRLLMEHTTSTPRCRSGECIHNQLVSISLAVVYFNLHVRCLALMH